MNWYNHSSILEGCRWFRFAGILLKDSVIEMVYPIAPFLYRGSWEKKKKKLKIYSGMPVRGKVNV